MSNMHFIESHFFRKQGLQDNPLRMTTCPFPYGPVLDGSVGPKRAITGVPIAAARCMGPESVVISSDDR
jgi:hypothetical protein